MVEVSYIEEHTFVFLADKDTLRDFPCDNSIADGDANKTFLFEVCL